MGGGGSKVSVPAQDAELADLNKQFLRLALAEAQRGPSDLETALEELAKLSIAEQQKTLTQGPTIPEPFRQAIRQSFDVAKGDVTRGISDTFEDFLRTSRRELIGRGLGEQGSSLMESTSQFAMQEQGKLLEQALARLGAAQAGAEVTGATDLAEMVAQALNLSTGRAGETLSRRAGLLGGGATGAQNYFSQEQERRLRAQMFNAQQGGGGGDMWSSLIGGGAAMGAALLLASTREAKENITPINLQPAVEKLLNAPIYQWNYKFDPPNFKHIGPLIENLPKQVVSPDGNFIDVISLLGTMLTIIQSQEKRIAQLERK